ncbi:hypothetical protein PR048_016340, partial [Dryococelus australis]
MTLWKRFIHIQSLQSRKSHHSLCYSKKIYLPDTLNVKKLHNMFNENTQPLICPTALIESSPEQICAARARQLSCHLFNIHTLSIQDSMFYMYDQTVARKGSDEIAAKPYDYIFHFLHSQCFGDISHLSSFLHGMRHKHGPQSEEQRIKLCTEWAGVIRNARVKYPPYRFIECEQSLFRGWNKFLKPKFKGKYPFASRPIKELEISRRDPQVISYHEQYNGAWFKPAVT